MRKVAPLIIVVDRASAAHFAAVVKNSGAWADAFAEWRRTTALYLMYWQGATDRAHTCAPADDNTLRQMLRQCVAELADTDFQPALFVMPNSTADQIVQQELLGKDHT